jgi:phospholipase C
MAEQERPPEGDGTSEPAPPAANATRRGVLKAGLIAGAAVGVGGWQSAAAEPAARTARPAARLTTAHLRAPGSMPYPDRPMGTDTIPQIDHIVVLMMENHSYDN